MHTPSTLLAPMVLLTLGALPVGAQAPTPTTQPTLLTIYMEEIKLGHEVAYERTSAGWPEAFEEAGHPDIFLAMESISGPPMAWYVEPHENYAAEGRSMKAIEDDPALSAKLEALWKEHTQHIESSRVVQLAARPDLSGGAFPDLNRERFWDITIYRVRPGHDSQFEQAARTYADVSNRLAPEASYRTYQVRTGMRVGTYLVFSSVQDYAGFDDMLAREATVWEGMSDDERQVFDSFGQEGLESAITYRFRLNPKMSYVNAEMKAADPEFWSR